MSDGYGFADGVEPATEVVDWEDVGRRIRLAADEAIEEWLPLEAFMNPANEIDSSATKRERPE